MRVRVVIQGESNAADESELVQLRNLISTQMSHLALPPAVFGVGMRNVELVEVADLSIVPPSTTKDSGTLAGYDLDLDALTVPQLAEMAEKRGVEVTRSDGRTDLDPKKADYVGALS